MSYDRLAPYYDAVYGDRVDYAGDARWLQEAFARFGAVPVRRVLDLGAGTGGHAAELVEAGLDVDGVDLSPALVEVARRKAPRARFHAGDMSRDLPRGSWDAAVSMFGAFCYLTSDDDVARMLALLRDRLPAGGVFAFELWSPYGWRPHLRWNDAALPDGGRLVMLHRSDFDVLRDDVYRFTVEHLVLREDALEERFVQEHALRLRTPAATARLLAENGWEAVHFSAAPLAGKTFEPPGPEEFRVMCVARRAA